MTNVEDLEIPAAQWTRMLPFLIYFYTSSKN